MKNTISIKVDFDDKKRLQNECVKKLLLDKPELDGMKFTTKFMFKRVVNYYLDVSQ